MEAEEEIWPIMRGRYFDQRLTAPTRLVFGADDFALRPQLLTGYERYADDMEVELVPDCGHFIADERPELGGRTRAGVPRRQRQQIAGARAQPPPGVCGGFARPP
ncbi:MAG: hypothetical protein WD827_02940 [Solirubrobacterales bacterium]